MAIGLPPKYEKKILHKTSKEACEERVIRAIKKIDLIEIGYIKNAFDYRTRNGIMTMGERILVYVGETEMLVISKSLNPGQFLDFGKNKKNVNHFFEIFNAL